MDKKKILVVEDDASAAQTLVEKLSEYDCSIVTRLKELEEKNLEGYDLILLDRQIKGGDAWAWLDAKIEAGQKLPPLVLMSGESDIERCAKYKKSLRSIDEVSKHPGSDFYPRLQKIVEKIFCPPSFVDVRDRLSGEYDRIYGGAPEPEITGIDQSMMRVREKIEKFGPKDIPILVTGETGTGKELVANAVHKKSRRSGGPFVSVNLSALSETMIENELFGHEKGSFTGAIKETKGKIQEADGVTLFLDEIADISPQVQVKLLRVLETQRFEKIGSNQLLEVNVRIVTATHKDLREEVRQNRFREDLYFRIGCVEIKLPPLRKRSRKDFDLLFEYFMREYEHKPETGVKTGAYRISEEVYRKLTEYPWPGNIRELKWTVYQMLTEASGNEDRPVVTREHLPDHILSPVCREKIQDEVTRLLHQIVEKEPVEISYERIERIQEELAVLLLRRLYEKCNGEWREMARRCGREDDSFLRPDKMKSTLKHIYDRVTQEKENGGPIESTERTQK